MSRKQILAIKIALLVLSLAVWLLVAGLAISVYKAATGLQSLVEHKVEHFVIPL